MKYIFLLITIFMLGVTITMFLLDYSTNTNIFGFKDKNCRID